ncbi:SCP2 sterol-binding domain-containing protein [Thalassovita mediterranea]|jgi:putative sterol carrier protein|uniref:Putative sterol carrier protein n=1 Tax=Thalassovita mediterranea TaxID=340021 RepID=A0A0P1GNC4_9RHOB|nr:SCP2 sterol-binding domain-containing protein [Thalassovita mediterranea]CUH83727.1 Putative sterol carrier protein [Thalassovita mediterranea]SIS28586.1 SCP-2 sterol transfer family protein [Thalassovita mediterranea]
MSDQVEAAVTALTEKMSGADFSGSAKFVVEGVMSIVVDGEGVRASEEDADVTMTADADTFESMMNGDLNPTAAFMSGKLTIDGDMGQAMALASAFA